MVAITYHKEDDYKKDYHIGKYGHLRLQWLNEFKCIRKAGSFAILITLFAEEPAWQILK